MEQDKINKAEVISDLVCERNYLKNLKYDIMQLDPDTVNISGVLNRSNNNARFETRTLGFELTGHIVSLLNDEICMIEGKINEMIK